MRLYFSSLVILTAILLTDFLFYRYLNRFNSTWSKVLQRFTLFSSSLFLLYYVSIILLNPLYADSSGGNIYLHFFIAITWFMIWYLPRIAAGLFFPLFATVGWVSGKKSWYRYFYWIMALFVSLPLYGVIAGRQMLVERFQEISFPAGIPSFKGYRVVQISDMHLGTMPWSVERWERYVDRINRLKPDLIVFTGDLVNNYWTETIGWDSVFARLQAADGKVAVLGNHDYGDYVPWKSSYDKFYNHARVLTFLRKNGFRLLNNQSFLLQRNGDTLVVAGVENWGHPPFPRYGNLNTALSGVGEKSPVLLLSHDPDHWEAEILHSGHNVFLTLAGHTHGFQTGIRQGKLKFSPAQWRYRYWGGYYTKNNRQLYVSTGVGFIAFMGRIGIWPEVVILDFDVR